MILIPWQNSDAIVLLKYDDRGQYFLIFMRYYFWTHKNYLYLSIFEFVCIFIIRALTEYVLKEEQTESPDDFGSIKW